MVSGHRCLGFGTEKDGLRIYFRSKILCTDTKQEKVESVFFMLESQ